MEEHHWQMPEWWCKENRPANDETYFENMCRVIFQEGLNWHVIDNKWQTTRKAFANFSINEVACFTPADVERLLKDEGIVRNRSKVEAIIYNARGFKAIKERFGSFQAYLDSLDKSKNYDAVVKDLTSKFKHLGPASASLFLYTVGEKIKAW
ncbi:MAG: DNA-3-methyladenine glycosylase I [Candidatus Bathyarchaeia archaeon]|jgi:3-methyladenine DNA glycosylase Tag